MDGDPVLHVVAGPNGAGKSTFYDKVLQPGTGLPVVNADLIAAEHWPGDAAHAYEAAALAGQARDQLIGERQSFVTETVFSRPSKVDLIQRARDAGYQATLHVLVVPEDGAVARVADRVANATATTFPRTRSVAAINASGTTSPLPSSVPTPPTCTTTPRPPTRSGVSRSTSTAASLVGPTGRSGPRSSSGSTRTSVPGARSCLDSSCEHPLPIDRRERDVVPTCQIDRAG
ncbi:MAG: zeta toxin family protein [Acidimicrobiales bacterium]